MSLATLRQSAAKEELTGYWQAYLGRILRPYYQSVLRAPLLIPATVLRRAKYLEHFPKHLFLVQSYRHPGRTKQFITPATCLHVYASLIGRHISKETVFVHGHCARFEDGRWEPPFRLPDFHMLELVVVGSPQTVTASRNRIEALMSRKFKALGLTGTFQPATDAFFLGSNAGAKLIQQLKGLKREFVVRVRGRNIALASLNYHEDFFGRRFGIRAAGAAAHSFCAAFGLERLVEYSLVAWGSDRRSWPRQFIHHV